MSLVDRLYDNVEGVFAWLSLALKQSALSYCDLETADSRHSLVTKDGALVSIIRLHGYRRFVGSNEFAYLCERMSETLQPAFSGSGGHFMQFYFGYDNTHIADSIEESLKPARETAARLKLEIDDLFQSRVETLSDICADEDAFIVLWTTPQALEKTHLKRVLKQRTEKLSKAKLPKMSRTQNLLAVLPEVRNIHDSFIHTILEDLEHTGFYVDLLDVHTAVYEVRKTVDRNFTDKTWRPHLPGDKLSMRLPPEGDIDIGDIMWPPLEEQIIPRDGSNEDMKTARVGDLIYAPIFIELFPKDIKTFYELFRRLLPANMPWRMSYFLAPGGIQISKSKNMLAQFLTFTSHHNKLLVESHRLLKGMHERSDNPIVKLYVCLSTWAKDSETDILKERVAKLAKVVQSWGGCEVRDVAGDPFGATMSSALAVTTKIVATPSAAPLSDAVHMMPLVRPASPWDQGALSFRTPDGKLWPYQPGSSHQISWIDLVYARSGSGKSVLLSTINLGLCLSSGLSSLPRMSIIDIGPSSKGFISLLKEGLPKARKHEVLYHRLNLTDDDAINAFDTQVGARFPTKLHRAFLINFISVLLVDNIEDRPPEGMTSMMSMIIDETYKRLSDNEQPKPYVAQVEPEIEPALEKLDLKADKKLTWWKVADALFEAGEHHLALKAQRQAMPTVADTISIAHTPSIKDLFGKVQTGTSEDYISAYCRIISSVIRNYPTLTCVTRLNLEGTRIVALDLDEVAKSGSAAAEKQTAIMYMLARHVLSQSFFLNSDEVARFPKQYQAFHKGRVKEIMEEPKRMVFDEFHRTSKSPVVREQIIQDMREGRKWKIHIALASQSLQDFDSLMVEFATSIFILDSGSAMSIDQTCKTFGLTDTEKQALSTRVHGPTAMGATFIAQFVTKRGMNTQLLTSTISPVELWAFSTTTEDVFIRDALYEEIGPVNARHMLASHFPRGSAVKDIESELKGDSTRTISEACDDIVKLLVKDYRQARRAKKLMDFK